MKLSINQTGFLRNLKSVFSGSSSVVTELLQNGRRAGAQSVHFDLDDGVLSVQDDGCGIEDFNKLLCLAESGWDENVSVNENPYGMGAMAMLFVGSKVEVKSKGKCLTINTATALSGGNLGEPIDDVEAPKKGTQINIYDFTLSEHIQSFILQAARCSSIPVYFNGDLVASPFSLSAMKKTNDYDEYDIHGIGKVLLRKGEYRTCHPAVIVQEMLVSGCLSMSRYNAGDFFIFATNELQVRMPDRNGLIDEEEQLVRIIDEVRLINKKRLNEERVKTADDRKFFALHWKTVLTESPEMFMTVDFLPSGMFTGVGGH